jgi:hypothetical protein
MTLLRRRPREVYRVYSEEEYLGGAGTQLGGIAGWHAAEPELAAHRLRRAAGVAMLAGVLGAVGGLVCLNLAWTHGGGATGRGSLLAAARPSRDAGSAPVADDARPQVESSRPVVVRPVETARSLVPSRSGASRKGVQDPGSSDRLPVHRPAHRHAGVVVLADYARRHSSSGEASAAPVSASASAPTPTSTQPAQQAGGTTTPAVATAPAHPAPEGQAEFGFER